MRSLARVRRTHGGVSGFASLVVKAALGIGLLAVVINDAGQLVVAQVRAQSVARAAATAGADTFFRTRRVDLAQREAVAAAQRTDPDAAILSIDIDPQAGTVTVRVEKMAKTLVVERFGPLKSYAAQGATDTERGTA